MILQPILYKQQGIHATSFTRWTLLLIQLNHWSTSRKGVDFEIQGKIYVFFFLHISYMERELASFELHTKQHSGY